MTAPLSRLIVSFIGRADLRSLNLNEKAAAATPDGLGPILRLLMHLRANGWCQSADTRVMLFDDNPRDNVRRRFRDRLECRLPELNLSGLPIDLHKIELPAGPTDLSALYHAVWSAIPSGSRAPNEVVFHLSSGTPAMQVTLLLAANCLPIEAARLFESSLEQGVIEIEPPYVIAARESKATRTRDRPALSRAARKLLLPHTVVDDPIVEAGYAALQKAAIRRGKAPAVLIAGPTGSGKWHAARQFAVWHSGTAAEWLLPPVPAGDVSADVVLVRRLDTWPAEALATLSAWRIQHPEVAIVATWRTDVVPAAPLEVVAREGLVGAEQVLLPALSARRDMVALGEAVAIQSQIWDGKIKERLQYDLLTDVYPRNLHDLKKVIATTASRSKGPHPERAAYLEARQLADAVEAQALLYECYQALAGLHFGEGRPKLDDVLKTIRALVMYCAQAGGRTHKDVGDLLGCSQQHVSNTLKQLIRLKDWRTRITTPHENAR